MGAVEAREWAKEQESGANEAEQDRLEFYGCGCRRLTYIRMQTALKITFRKELYCKVKSKVLEAVGGSTEGTLGLWRGRFGRFLTVFGWDWQSERLARCTNIVVVRCTNEHYLGASLSMR